MFYPDDPGELRDMVQGFLAAGERRMPRPKALIAPHAGYVYSGPIAGSSFAQTADLRGTVSRVVLIGPSHRIAFDGLAVPSAAAFATPFGPVEVDRDAIRAATLCPGVRTLDAAHANEHALEVELPFLTATLGDFRLVPVVTGDAEPEEVAGLLDTLWGGPETLIVVSSDLSHYLPYRAAQAMDRATTQSIEAWKPADLRPEQACGRLAIQGLLLAGRRRGLRELTVDVRNSGDTAGTRDQVVGYGAYAFG
jgi:hypothetical protein